jgi:hypothetical protein
MWTRLFGRTETPRRRQGRRFTLGAEALEQRRMMDASSAWVNGPWRVDAWQQWDSLTHDYDIKARVAYNGAVVRNLTVASSLRDETSPSCSINANGVFAVAYEDQFSSSDTDTKLFIGGDGYYTDTTYVVANTTRRESDPSVSINRNRDVVVSYTDQWSSTDLDVRAVKFTSVPAFYITSGPYVHNRTTYAVDTSSNNQFDSSARLNDNGNFAVAYTHRYSSTDLDIKAAVFRGGVRTTTTIAASTANETSPYISYYDGSGTLTVYYTVNGLRKSVTKTV